MSNNETNTETGEDAWTLVTRNVSEQLGVSVYAANLGK